MRDALPAPLHHGRRNLVLPPILGMSHFQE